MALLIIFLLLSTFSSLAFSIDIPITSPQKNITVTGFTMLQLPVGSTGSLAFDLLNGGPYTGTLDGRILKTKAFCDGSNTFDKSAVCGLPGGLGYNYITGKLYASDASIGLTVVGPLGGLATTLVPTKNGVPYRFLVGVDVASDNNVYFTDASAIYGPKDAEKSIQSGDSTARLLQYDQKTKKVTVLLSQLAGAVGVATNTNASFLLVSEFIAKRIRRYWLQGEKAGTSEIFLTFPGNPNKIKRNQEGNFWVAPQGVKISPSGEILATVDLSKNYNRRITVVQEQSGKLYVAGLNITYVGQYDIKYVWN